MPGRAVWTADEGERCSAGAQCHTRLQCSTASTGMEGRRYSAVVVMGDRSTTPTTAAIPSWSVQARREGQPGQARVDWVQSAAEAVALRREAAPSAALPTQHPRPRQDGAASTSVLCPLSSHTTSSHPTSHLASFFAVRAVCQWTALTDMVMAAAAAAKMTGAVLPVLRWQRADGASHLMLPHDPARPPPPPVVAVAHRCTEPHRSLIAVLPALVAAAVPFHPRCVASSSSSVPPPPPRLPHALLLTRCCPPLLDTSCPHVSSHRRARHRSLLLLCICFACSSPSASSSSCSACQIAGQAGHEQETCMPVPLSGLRGRHLRQAGGSSTPADHNAPLYAALR